jgi:hypothetical protein
VPKLLRHCYVKPLRSHSRNFGMRGTSPPMQGASLATTYTLFLKVTTQVPNTTKQKIQFVFTRVIYLFSIVYKP